MVPAEVAGLLARVADYKRERGLVGAKAAAHD